MSDVLKPIDIVGNVHNASIQADKMRYEADRLELSAKNYRGRADDRVIEGFEEANRHLVATWQSGEFSNAELLRAQLELREADPIIRRVKNEPSTEELLARFAMLVPGEYVLGFGHLYPDNSYATGVVSQLPTNFRIIPGLRRDPKGELTGAHRYSPTATFDIAIKSFGDGNELADYAYEVNDTNLGLGMIGHEEIAKTIGGSDFTIGQDGLVRKLPFATRTRRELASIRSQIDMLYQLGMEKIDTEPLDSAIKSERIPTRPWMSVVPARKRGSIQILQSPRTRRTS